TLSRPPRPVAERAADPAGDGPPARFVGCDVRDARELIGAIAELAAPHAIVSNSDHLQTQTALAAAYFDLPGKDWRSAVRAKDKSLMRRRLAEAGIERVAAAPIRAGGHPPDGLRYPVVLKPAEGVASEDVVLVASPEELAEQSARILARRPGETLLAEEYLPGELRTLETLGDGKRTWVLGGVRTTLSRCARRAWHHFRRLPHRVRRRRSRPGPDRGERPADRRPLRLRALRPAR